MLGVIGAAAIVLILLGAFGSISGAVSGGNTTTINSTTINSNTTVQSTTIQSTTIQSTTSQFFTTDVTSVFDTTQITSQTTVVTTITSNSCSTQKYGVSINGSGFLGCKNIYLGSDFFRSSPVYPVTTVTGAFRQVGLAYYFTPNTTNIFINGVIATQTNTATCGTYAQLDYGTGTAPVQGVSQTGTLVGNPITFFFVYTGLSYSQPVSDLISSLSAGTTYWFDFAFTSAPGSGCGTATFTSDQITMIQI